MSLILDALRKMEQERKARQGGGIDLRPEVLGRSRIELNRRPWGKPFFLVAAGVVLLAAGAGGGIALKKGAEPKLSQQSPAVPSSEAHTAEAVTPPELPPPSLPPAPAVQPAVTEPPEPAPSPAPVAMPTPRPSQRPLAVEQPSSYEYPGANLTVSGIAWQDERSLRRAVVNGNLVGEGAEVAGARVVEIGERRVKFFQGGRTISVSLSSPFQGR